MGYPNSMRLGVLDIGSNSAQLQIVDGGPGASPMAASTVKQPTRLADEIQPDGTVSDNGIRRVAAAVTAALDAARQHRVDELIAFATSAIRDARNRDQILERVHTCTGICPHFLSGEDDAALTYNAIRSWYGHAAGRLLAFDIGGGSLEIAVGKDAEPEMALSLPLGAGRLTRTFLEDDPPTKYQLNAARQHVRAHLREVDERMRAHDTPALSVATSKTMTQLARLAGAPPPRKGPFARRSLRATDLEEWLPHLAGIPAHQRARLPGISAPRSRQVLAGALVAQAAMDALDIDTFEICPWAVREGIVLRHLSARRDALHSLGLQPVDPTIASRGRERPRTACPSAVTPDNR